MQTFQFHHTDNVVTCTLMINDKVMKISIFSEYNYSVILSCLDLMAFVKELGGVESTPQTNFIETAGRVEKTVGGFNPPRQLNH